MAASTHYVFEKPSNVDTPIWRYMDFTKFVSMLENSGLYLARADKLGDPFEGSYSRGNEKQRPDVYKDKRLEDILPSLGKWAQLMRYKTFVNCWHMNYHESAAMWYQYAKTNEAIAIRSTFQKLDDLLDSDCLLGVIKYIDYEHDWLPEGNLLFPFVHKRLSFAHEQEIRVVVQDNPNLPNFVKEIRPDGIWKKLDLSLLIEEIYVAPTSPTWFHELVEKVISKYELNKPVIQSTLDKEPFF